MSVCRGQLEAVSAFLDGELPPEEELELRRHLDGCKRFDRESLCAFAGVHETLAVVAASAELAQAFRSAAHVVENP